MMHSLVPASLHGPSYRLRLTEKGKACHNWLLAPVADCMLTGVAKKVEGQEAEAEESGENDLLACSGWWAAGTNSS